MSTRPFFAARAEETLDRWQERLLRSLGWREKVICYTGYGTTQCIRVLARVVLIPGRASTGIAKDVGEFVKRRGFRNFYTVPCVRVPINITVGKTEYRSFTDRGGYIDFRIHDHGLAPGWRTITINSRGSKAVKAEVQVIGDDETFGIISDIDDTVISTWLPRLFIAFWNSFIRDESARQSPPGMAQMYQRLLDDHPGAPVIYISTGAWDTYSFLRRFLSRHRFPDGPMLLTDWGPTNTGWFRSGSAHKANTLQQLIEDLPGISWVLVGDDGQHDLDIYSTFAEVAPRYVRAIAIRRLAPIQQVLAHGTLTPLDERMTIPDIVPTVIARDGRGLLAGIQAALAKQPQRELDLEGSAE
jgi:phosphatidate phosphatase APP1